MAYSSKWPPDRVALLSRRARDAGLVVTGGSDWHGPDDGPLGTFRVDARDIAAFLEAEGFSASESPGVRLRGRARPARDPLVLA